jgi:hypothetical protein
MGCAGRQPARITAATRAATQGARNAPDAIKRFKSSGFAPNGIFECRFLFHFYDMAPIKNDRNAPT